MAYSVGVRYVEPTLDTTMYETSEWEDFGRWSVDNSRWSTDPGITNHNASFMRSMPQQTQTLDSNENSISVSIGANAGFADKALTAGISGSIITESSHSSSVPSVELRSTVINRDSEAYPDQLLTHTS
ncbi:hypothetical protein LTR78_003554 [Recurvomyces mirabilis]|uniref:Uncharacterized protein n=1 Tax=Recurvomyces mirabilis TaxID=574656 RepID=A0AAE0WS12_9PEZI|nr:hypothetical protein LTR78_003554 [Recurvomyces mirabilis]